MKFSEAWVLGSTMIKFNAHLFLACGEGCLRGAAYFAATGNHTMEGGMDDAEVWPWLEENRLSPLPYPTEGSMGLPYAAAYIINEIAFAVERGEWTIEQALDWIRANEPSEPVTAPSAELVRVGKE